MEDWDTLMQGQPFITDLGEPPDGMKGDSPDRYAVWSPMRAGKGHKIIEVGPDLDALMQRYDIPPTRVCILVT